MPKTRTDTRVMKIIITIARFSIKGVGTLSLSGPNPGGSGVVSVGFVDGFGGFVFGMISDVVVGGCVEVVGGVVDGVLLGVVGVVVVVVDVVVDVVVVDLIVVVIGSVTI